MKLLMLHVTYAIYFFVAISENEAMVGGRPWGDEVRRRQDGSVAATLYHDFSKLAS